MPKRIPINNAVLMCGDIPYIYIDNEAFAVDEKGHIDFAATPVLRNMLKTVEKIIDADNQTAKKDI